MYIVIPYQRKPKRWLSYNEYGKRNFISDMHTVVNSTIHGRYISDNAKKSQILEACNELPNKLANKYWDEESDVYWTAYQYSGLIDEMIKECNEIIDSMDPVTSEENTENISHLKS
jgi:hypothetical protein